MLTSLGIATIGIEPWFLPVVVALLVVGLWGFWQSAKVHGKLWPFAAAVLSSGSVIVGRCLELPVVLWSGAGTLAAVYVCDWWMRKGPGQ